MTHYQKIATVAFRVAGIIIMHLGGGFSLIGFISAFVDKGEKQIIFILMMCYCFGIFTLGMSFYISSKLLAKLACFGLNKFDEK